jgi:hypothetical protein
MTPPIFRSCVSSRQHEASIEMGATVSGRNFGVDYPLALACGQAAKILALFSDAVHESLPYNLVFRVCCVDREAVPARRARREF